MRIGFSFNSSKGGPANFMNNLKIALETQGIAKTSVYFNPLNDCNIFANLAKLVRLKKFFFRLDGVNYDLLADPQVKKRINDDLLSGARLSNGVIYQSEFSKKLVETILGYKPPRQAIIHNGTNLDIFKRGNGKEIRQMLNIPEEAFVFVTSAKWRIHKRLASMIESFADFRQRHPSLQTYLLVIGEHKDLNIENVIFTQRVDNKLLPQYYSASNVYLFYSWLDNCPNSVIEAISCGLPAICTNQGGTHELIEMSQGGIVVDADKDFPFEEVELYNPPQPDMHKIAKALDEMYDNYPDYVRRIKREVFDINAIARKYYDFIKANI